MNEKPHIVWNRAHEAWICFGFGHAAKADSPAMAYKLWVRLGDSND